MDIQIQKLECMRCGHTWVPRKKEVRICPACKSAYWDLPKKDGVSKKTLEKQEGLWRDKDAVK